MGNRDKFPEQFQSETDFWLYVDTTYMVPQLSGAMASAIQTNPSGEQPSMVTIMNGLTANQEQMADELARLTREFGTLAVSDIDGLGEMVAQVSQQAEGFAEVQDVVQRLEAAYVDLQNGELTTGMLNAIRSENNAVLEEIAALQEADTQFNLRLTEVEAEVTALTEQLPATVQTEVANQLSEQTSTVATVQSTVEGMQNGLSQIQLVLAAVVIALLIAAVGFLAWIRHSSQSIKAEFESHSKQLTGEGCLAEQQETLNEQHESLANKLEALSAEVHDEHDGLAATRDMAATALSQNSILTFLDTPDLKFIKKGTTSSWKISVGDKDSDDYQLFEVSFTKRDDGLFDWSVPRNKDGKGESEPVKYKSIDSMKTKLQQAHIHGRLQYCAVDSSGSAKVAAA
jgi:hypothetical protein